MPKCSQCPHEAETLGQLRKHYAEAGHPTKERKKRGGNSEPAEPEEEQIDVEAADDVEESEEVEEIDSELALLNDCTNAFLSANTDREQDFRVLEYLAQRFGPIAYPNIEVDDPNGAAE